MVNTIKILSMNRRGIQDNSKRMDVFNFLRNKKYSILGLQDTHFSEKDNKIIRAQWGAEIYSSPGKTNARGVSILLSHDFEYNVLAHEKDGVGNFLSIENRNKTEVYNMFN